MKSKALGTKLLMALVCLAVLAYFGLQIWGYYTDPLTTAVAYSYQVEKGATVSGWAFICRICRANWEPSPFRTQRPAPDSISATMSPSSITASRGMPCIM